MKGFTALPRINIQRALSVREFAELNGIDPSTVMRLIKSGEVPAYRIGNSWRIRADVADAITHAND